MLPLVIKNLIDQLSCLPGIGQRAATRLAFWLLNQPQQDLETLALIIKELKIKTKTCQECFNLSNDTLCQICSDTRKDKKIICVVEDILDILPIENTHQYQGVYHVLGGLISPPQGIGPENLKIKELFQRINKLKQNFPAPEIEVILAFNPSAEGDTTTLYLERQLRPLQIKITRLARGLSSGSDLEYTDETTLTNALKGRK